jgi:hypothetical protein
MEVFATINSHAESLEGSVDLNRREFESRVRLQRLRRQLTGLKTVDNPRSLESASQGILEISGNSKGEKELKLLILSPTEIRQRLNLEARVDKCPIPL